MVLPTDKAMKFFGKPFSLLQKEALVKLLWWLPRTLKSVVFICHVVLCHCKKSLWGHCIHLCEAVWWTGMLSTILWVVAKCLLPYTQPTYSAFIQCQCILHPGDSQHCTFLCFLMSKHWKSIGKRVVWPFNLSSLQKSQACKIYCCSYWAQKRRTASQHLSVHNAETHFLYHFENHSDKHWWILQIQKI